jgi:hypothetical protein
MIRCSAGPTGRVTLFPARLDSVSFPEDVYGDSNIDGKRRKDAGPDGDVDLQRPSLGGTPAPSLRCW